MPNTLMCHMDIECVIWDNIGVGRCFTPDDPENTMDRRRLDPYCADVDAALEAFQDARDRMNARHEELVAVLGRPGMNVTEARARFDRAEDRMRRARRMWWIAIAWARQSATGADRTRRTD